MSRLDETARAAAVIAVGALASPAGALELEQFAVGWALDLPEEQGVFDVALTREIYEHAEDLEQIAILDGDGRPVSFYRVAVPRPETEERRVLDASPLYAAAANGALADVDITSGPANTRVRVARPADEAEVEVVGFLIDARDVEWSPVAMELDWRAVERPFLIDVVVEHAPELAGWRAVGRGSVASLIVDGSETRHVRVPIAAASGGYYRFAASRAVPDWSLQRVTLVGAQRGEAVTQSVSVPPVEATDDALVFYAGGPLPVRSVSLDFGDRNGWVRAALASRGSEAEPWRARSSSRLFYDVTFEGQTFANEPVVVGRVEDRRWRVSFDGEPRTVPVAIVLEYVEEHLRFAADGPGPYTLAAGTIIDEAGPDPAFEAVLAALGTDSGAVRAASLGEMRELGGDAARSAPAEFPWARAGLWAVLALGVLVVALMALKLGREMLDGAEKP